MAKYFLSNLAKQDIQDIWNYTYKNWSEAHADKYYRALFSSFKYILENPILFGKDYSFIKTGLKGYRMQHHLIFYFILSSNEIFITRILHESMDIKSYTFIDRIS